MRQDEHSAVYDKACILEFLKRRPYDFISEVEISRKADGQSRFVSEPNWAHTALSRLLALDLVEADASRNYRFKTARFLKAKVFARKFISPQIEMVFRQNGQKIAPARRHAKKLAEEFKRVRAGHRPE